MQLFCEVECYSQRNDSWTLCPSLIRPKGSLAGVTLNGKIFALGGGDGCECFSDVEMFDPATGRWIYSQSMLQKVHCSYLFHLILFVKCLNIKSNVILEKMFFL